MSLQEIAERGARLRHENRERLGGLLQPGKPAPDGAVAPSQRRSQAAEPRRGPGTTQDRPLHRPDGAAPCSRRHAAGRERMLERREQRHRRGLFRDHPGGEPETGAGWRLAERHTRRIVDLDLPAPKLRRDPARQRTVHGDEGGGAAGSLQRAPHNDGDDARFLLRAGAVDAVKVAQRLRPLRRQCAPGGDGLGRPHGVGHQAGARAGCAGAVLLLARPRLHVAARDADMGEQPLERVLRMGGADGLPGLVVGLGVEAGEDDHALRQARDGGQQVAGGGHAPCRARADHRMRRRFRRPALRKSLKQGVAAGGRVHLAPLRQDRGPTVGDEREEAQHLLPMGCVLLRRERGQPLRIHPGDLNLVEQAGQRLGEPCGLIGSARPGERRAARRLAEPLDQPRQQQAALQRRDGVGQRLVGLVAEAHLVLVDIAEGPDARQQQRPARRGAQEGEAERPAGAACGQQDCEAAQRERVAGVERHRPARQNPARERVDERIIRRHLVDGGRARAHRSPPRRSPPRKRSACSSPSGEPTWSMWPRCTMPNRRSARIASS